MRAALNPKALNPKAPNPKPESLNPVQMQLEAGGARSTKSRLTRLVEEVETHRRYRKDLAVREEEKARLQV